MKIGDRVISTRGEIGIVEEVDGDFIDIRFVTPKNKPSCCCSTFRKKDLKIIGDNVVPMPKSEEWYQESKEFYDFISSVILEKIGN